MLVRSRWKTPLACKYSIPLAISLAKQTLVTWGRSIDLFWISCSREPPLMYSVRACNCPSWTHTPINLQQTQTPVSQITEVQVVSCQRCNKLYFCIGTRPKVESYLLNNRSCSWKLNKQKLTFAFYRINFKTSKLQKEYKIYNLRINTSVLSKRIVFIPT